MRTTPLHRRATNEISFEPPAAEVTAIEGELPGIAAQIAIRFLQAGLLSRLILVNGCFRDHDVLELIGINLEEGLERRLSKSLFEEGMKQQLKQLRTRPYPTQDTLNRNLQEMAQLLSLTHAAVVVLSIGVITYHIPALKDLWRLCRRGCMDEFVKLVADTYKLPANAVKSALGRDSALRHAGLLTMQLAAWDDADDGIDVDPRVAEVLLDQQFDAARLLNAVALPAPPPSLTLDAFAHQRTEVETAARYIKAAAEEGKAGVNILIYGDPGVGKTELARLLARDCGLCAHEVPAEDRDGDALRGTHRVRSFIICQRLLDGQANRCVIFDEVEDVFPVSDTMALHRSHGERALPKRFVNEILEHAPVPSFWIANSVFQIDPAFVRRFDLVIALQTPPRSSRLRMLENAFAGVPLPSSALRSAAQLESLSPALISTTAGVLERVADQDPERNWERFQLIAGSALRAMGQPSSWPSVTGPTHYNLDWLNPSQPLTPIIDGLRVGRQARICFYGPPGTGKTALAHHLSDLLDRPLMSFRASDLLSKWLGGTERRIATAFATAKRENAILLIDEADSLIASREQAEHRWEISQANEMLTQMESFDGIFIASTNLAASLDPASLRRFDYKLRFDPPNTAQRRLMVCESFRQMTSEGNGELAQTIPPESLQGIDRLTDLCPGDIAVVLRQCAITDERPDFSRWLQLLRSELQSKQIETGRTIGFVH